MSNNVIIAIGVLLSILAIAILVYFIYKNTQKEPKSQEDKDLNISKTHKEPRSQEDKDLNATANRRRKNQTRPSPTPRKDLNIPQYNPVKNFGFFGKLTEDQIANVKSMIRFNSASQDMADTDSMEKIEKLGARRIDYSDEVPVVEVAVTAKDQKHVVLFANDKKMNHIFCLPAFTRFTYQGQCYQSAESWYDSYTTGLFGYAPKIRELNSLNSMREFPSKGEVRINRKNFETTHNFPDRVRPTSGISWYGLAAALLLKFALNYNAKTAFMSVKKEAKAKPYFFYLLPESAVGEGSHKEKSKILTCGLTEKEFKSRSIEEVVTYGNQNGYRNTVGRILQAMDIEDIDFTQEDVTVDLILQKVEAILEKVRRLNKDQKWSPCYSEDSSDWNKISYLQEDCLGAVYDTVEGHKLNSGLQELKSDLNYNHSKMSTSYNLHKSDLDCFSPRSFSFDTNI